MLESPCISRSCIDIRVVGAGDLKDDVYDVETQSRFGAKSSHVAAVHAAVAAVAAASGTGSARRVSSAANDACSVAAGDPGDEHAED